MIGAFSLSVLSMMVGGLGLLAGLAYQRARAGRRRERVCELVTALCALNAEVARDRDLTRLLLTHVEAPHRLDRIDRVRARAWFDNVRRLHGLLRAELAATGATTPPGGVLPSMGEPMPWREGLSDGSSNLTLIDPEFLAAIHAQRGPAGNTGPRPAG